MKVMRITPELAKSLLGKNTTNRPVSKSTVASYARMITDNKWELNGETIKITKSGVLLDGQHRLLAVIMANKAVDMFVIDNLPDEKATEFFATIDAGKSRTTADVLACNGYEKYRSVIAGSWSWYESFSNNQKSSVREKLAAKEAALAYVEKYFNIIQECIERLKKSREQNKICSLSFIVGFCVFCHQKNYQLDDAVSFMDTFLLGYGDKGHPANILRAYLNKNNIRINEIEAKVLLQLFQKAFDNTIKKRFTIQLRYNPEEKFVLPENKS